MTGAAETMPDASVAELPGTHGPDVTALLVAQHHDIAGLFAGARRTRSSSARRRAVEMLGRAVAVHEAAEQAALYPVLAHLPGGRDLRKRALADEREIAIQLARVLRRVMWNPQGRGLLRQLDQLERLVRAHGDEEERIVFPLLVAGASLEKLQMMGWWVERTEAFAPTRPHPHGPRRLPGLIFLGPALAVQDRLRDWLRARVSG